jgi:hypothetical protein
MIMTRQIIKRFSTRLAVWLAAVLIMTAVSHTVWAQQGQQDDFPVLPQATDANNPTPITSRSFSGELRGSGQDYFYSLTAGPGQASLTLVVVVAEGRAAQAVVDVYDQNGSPLLSNLAVRGTTNGEAVSQRFMVATRQNVFLRVRDTSGSQGIFGVQLDGAVKAGQAGAGQGLPAQGSGYPAQTTTRPSDRPGNVQLRFHTKKHGTFTVTFNVGDHWSPSSGTRER